MPKTVKIGTHTYTILRRGSVVLGNNLGDCDCNGLQITVKQRLKRSKAQEITLHEIQHAIILQSLMGDKMYEDEDFIVATSPLLLQVLQENPELVAYLTQ